jgi:hypothetical protein
MPEGLRNRHRLLTLRRRVTLLQRHRTHRRPIRVAVQGLVVRAVPATEHKIVDRVERRGIEPAAVPRAVARAPGNRIVRAKVEATRIVAAPVVRRQTIADRQGRITIVDRRVIMPTTEGAPITMQAIAAPPTTMQAIAAEPTTARTAAVRTIMPAIAAEPTAETTVEATPTLAIEGRVVLQITISRREAGPSR